MRKNLRSIIALIIMLALPLRGYAAIDMMSGCNHAHETPSSVSVAMSDADQGHYDLSVKQMAHTQGDHDDNSCGDKCSCGSCMTCTACGAFTLTDMPAFVPNAGILIHALANSTLAKPITPEGLLRPPSVRRLA